MSLVKKLTSTKKYKSYISKNTIEDILEDPDFIIRLASKLKEEKEDKSLLLERAYNLEKYIEEEKPYIDFAKSIASSHDGITFGEFAKILNNDNKKIGRNTLYKWFRDNGYLISKGSEKNIPKQKYINRGLFKVEENIAMTRNGEKISTKVLITGKGQKYFKERFDF